MGTHCSKETEKKRWDACAADWGIAMLCTWAGEWKEQGTVPFFFLFYFQSPEDSPGQHTALWFLRTFNILPLSMLNIGKNSWCGQYVVRRKVKHFCREHKRLQRLQIKNTTRTDFWPRLPVSRCTAALSPKWLATAIVPYKQKKWGQM